MPTTLTCDIYTGKKVSFLDFVMKCAGFESIVGDRDGTIPDEFFPDNTHLHEAEAAKIILAKAEKWSDEDAEKEVKRDFDKNVRSFKGECKRIEKIKQAYLAMLKQVENWVPPTNGHEELKSFMIDQLVESIKFDCSYSPTMPERLSGEQYRAQLINWARREIEYETKCHIEEVSSVREQNEWLRALRLSLNNATAPNSK